MKTRLSNPATAGIVAAALASCNGAIALTKSPDTADAGVAEDAAGAPTIGEPLAQPALDAGADILTACPECAPPTDPYWDSVFPEAGVAPADGSVCGIISRGGWSSATLVTKTVFDALVLRAQGRHPACSLALCDVPECWPVTSPYDAGDAALACAPDGGVYPIACAQVGRPVQGKAGAQTVEGKARTFAGAYLAQQTALEAASVVAFERLAEDLERLRAPRSLVDACIVAAQEEQRHAAVTSALAQRLGGPSVKLCLGPQNEQTLLSLALSNAVDGVVRETFAAAVAVHHAMTAASPTLRAQLSGIAHDELSHAALSRDIHAWALPQLTDHERALVHDAMRDAIGALCGDAAPGASDLRDASLDMIGAPTASALEVMRDHLVVNVWGPEVTAGQRVGPSPHRPGTGTTKEQRS